MKKLLSLCLALVLAIALAVPAAAADTRAAGGGVSVQVNGEDVAFPNASPEVRGGRTMVPMRAVLEALGAAVDYDTASRTVTAAFGDTVLTHVIGTDKIDVKGGSTLTMDTTSYVKSGSTLVPLRFFSQALGYEVYWDSGAQTAVVINKNDLVASIDKNFTILNDIQSKSPAISGNMAMDMDMKGQIKLLDGSLDDAIPFSAKMSAVYSEEAMNMDGSMDLSALAQLPGAEADPAVAAMLKDLSFKMIFSDAIWMGGTLLASAMLSAPDGVVPADLDSVWFKAGDFDMSALTAASDGEATIGSVLYGAIAYMDAEVPVNIYDDVNQAALMAQMLLGDATFTKNGEDYSWTLDEKTSALLAQAIGETPDSFSLTMDMDVKADGASSFSMDLKADVMSMSVSGASTATESAVKCQVVVPDACDVSVECNASMTAGSGAPVTAPPAGATVIDLTETLESSVGAIGGADGPTSIFAA